MSNNDDEEQVARETTRQERLADMADCLSCTQDLLSQWIPALDFVSDLAVVILAIMDASYLNDSVFFAGFVVFWVSQEFRVFHESLFTKPVSRQADRQDIRRLVFRESYHCNGQSTSSSSEPCERFCTVLLYAILGAVYVLLHFALMLAMLLVGAVNVFLHAIVLILFLPDFIMSLAYNMKVRKQGRFTMVLLSGWLWTMHEDWQECFYSKGFLRRYYHVFVSLLGGGRWIATSYWEWMETCQTEAHARDVASGFCRFSLAMAICEEVLENVGGFLMSISVLMNDWNDSSGGINDRALAIFQLTMSVISAIFETGTILGTLKNNA